MKYLSILVVVLSLCSCGASKNVVQEPSKTEATTAQQEFVIAVKETDTTAKVLSVGSSKVDTIPIKKIELKDSLAKEMAEPQLDIKSENTLHQLWDELLGEHVSPSGKVNYSGFKSDYKTLLSYIEILKATPPNDNTSKEEKLAYWINAYNALTIDLILQNYPLNSIKDIKDPWDQRLWKFGDKWINLNDIEHKILRKMNEPRIHFAIVCASESCPILLNEAFTARQLERQLTAATKAFLQDNSKNEISENEIKLSKIFKWFAKDFKTNGTLIDFIDQYSDVNISAKAKKNYKNYDWSLNN